MTLTDASRFQDHWPAPAYPTSRDLAQKIARHGGRLLMVGGAVRDALSGQPSSDLDLEIFGVDPAAVERLLKGEGCYIYVGRSFPVWKNTLHNIDVALPRIEEKSGPRHQDFQIEVAPHISLKEASRRRDFTLNAIAFDPLEQAVIDPWGGLHDLAHKTLRHVSEKFAEDPLRVLRAMQFIARFELACAPETLDLCQQLSSDHLPRERIGAEWEKLLLQGSKPSLGLLFLRACGWLKDYPELLALVDCPQDPAWHPEGDVWTHTLLCLDATVALRTGHRDDDLITALAVLCHDLGKATHTQWIDGRWRSPGHEQAGVEPSERLLRRITGEERIIETVLPLVETHMRPYQLFHSEASDSAIRRLSLKAKRLDLLIRVATADSRGRGGNAAQPFPAGAWLEERAAKLLLSGKAPKPLVLARHLIALGYEAGPALGALLNTLFEAQLDGGFDTVESGIAYARKHLPGA